MTEISALIQAAHKGNTGFVIKWLQDNPSIHPDALELQARGLTPLYVACLEGKSGVAKVLLRAGADINYKSGEEEILRTPLYAAYCGKHYDMMARLVDLGADVSARYDDGSTILHCALFNDSVAVFRKIVGLVGNLDATDGDGDTALMVCAGILQPNSFMKHQVEKTRILLKAGASFSIFGDDGRSAIHRAADRGNHTIVRLLSDAGASVSGCTHHGQTALTHAVTEGQLEVLRVLVQAGADFEEIWQGGGTALMFAAEHGQAEIVSYLLEMGASTFPPNDSTHAPLYLAAQNGHTTVVQQLISAGADVNDGSLGVQPLRTACQHDHPNIVRELVRAGANPVFSSGSTALHMAAGSAHVDVARVLLKEGCLETCITESAKLGICSPACHVGEMCDDVTRDPLKEQCTRRLLARGPAFCARSWLWPAQTVQEDPDIAGSSASGKDARSGAGGKTAPFPWKMLRHRQKDGRKVDVIKILCRRDVMGCKTRDLFSAMLIVFGHGRGSYV